MPTLWNEIPRFMDHSSLRIVFIVCLAGSNRRSAAFQLSNLICGVRKHSDDVLCWLSVNVLSVSLSLLGDKYWVFKEVTAEPGYPHSLVELGSCLPREGIDTALRWEHVGKTYFFKGDRYWRYNEDKRATDPGYPKPITVWKGIPQSPQGAFVSKESCKH